jgi:hypothetical protein
VPPSARESPFGRNTRQHSSLCVSVPQRSHTDTATAFNIHRRSAVENAAHRTYHSHRVGYKVVGALGYKNVRALISNNIFMLRFLFLFLFLFLIQVIKCILFSRDFKEANDSVKSVDSIFVLGRPRGRQPRSLPLKFNPALTFSALPNLLHLSLFDPTDVITPILSQWVPQHLATRCITSSFATLPVYTYINLTKVRFYRPKYYKYFCLFLGCGENESLGT